MKLTIKKSVIYLLGLAMLGICVTLIQKTNLGMSSWDAFYRNLYEGIPLEYKYLNPIIALILIPIAYLIQKKRWSLWMLFPLVISFYIGVIIDLLLLVIPSVVGAGLFWNILYLVLAMIICAIGLNFVVFCQYPLPALDELCYGIGAALKSTYGKGKLIGEILALVLAIISGVIFSHYEQYFFIGPTTIIFALGIGKMIDVFKKPVFKLLEVFDAN
ncbi:MAG: hypothetical protein CVV56_00950 [Tenericutes bacterium HGW-Tenericutes-1]|jgi:uncharacterized membrane protein YczE|nr:MAG: hypothetical protein CVV56_00950 [Tenericutes bacterium HGW-Tenericutes-1]